MFELTEIIRLVLFVVVVVLISENFGRQTDGFAKCRDEMRCVEEASRVGDLFHRLIRLGD